MARAEITKININKKSMLIKFHIKFYNVFGLESILSSSMVAEEIK